MLYGFRDSMEEMARQRTLLARNDPRVDFHPLNVDVHLDAPGICGQVMTPETLPLYQFANVMRTNKQVQAMMLAYFVGYQKGLVENDDIRKIAQMADHPHLFGRLIKEPEFKHLRVLVFPVTTDRGIRQFALVTKQAKIVADEKTGDPVIQNPQARITATLPPWLKTSEDPKEAPQEVVKPADPEPTPEPTKGVQKYRGKLPSRKA